MRKILRNAPQLPVAAVLLFLVLAVFWQVGHHPFIRFDDNKLISENPHVRAGLTWEGVRWAFATASGESFWHPMTWLSFMLDVELFGLDAGWHHRMALLYHTLNALLLFAVLHRMTGKLWQSGVVAILFAIHPLHVESVAWAAERKDTLSTLFWMLSMWAYVRYAERAGFGRYLAVVAFFALGLMAKPMLVTLPFVLLLLDFWPLGRVVGVPGAREWACPKVPSPRLVLEKVPLFLLAAASAAMTLLPNRRGSWIGTTDDFPWSLRIANALVSYVRYIAETVWPSSLAIFYPHPGRRLSLWAATGAGLFLLGATAFVVSRARKQPYLPVGWFWFLGTLVPVIGLVQVGSQAMADHFTYVPLIGLFVAVVWWSPELVPKGWDRERTLAVSGGLLVLAFAVAGWRQAGFWRSEVALFSHAIEVTEDNPVAQAGLASALDREGRYAEAVGHYMEVIRVSPGYDGGLAQMSLAEDLIRLGRRKEAEKLLKSLAGDAEGANEIGLAFAGQGKIDEAASAFLEAIRLRPDFPEAHYNLAVALGRLGRKEEAIPHFREALRIPPRDADACNRIGVSLMRLGRTAEAVSRFREALRLSPGHAEARFNLAVSLERSGRRAEAIGLYREILRDAPGDRDARERLEALR
jgi:Flp pilus assembly protein TadD